jgi:hypothetical protein
MDPFSPDVEPRTSGKPAPAFEVIDCDVHPVLRNGLSTPICRRHSRGASFAGEPRSKERTMSPYKGGICKGLVGGTWPPSSPGDLKFDREGEVLI